MEKMEFSGKQRAEAMHYRWTKRADVWKTEALVLILLTAFTFVINRHMEIKGLCMASALCFPLNSIFSIIILQFFVAVRMPLKHGASLCCVPVIAGSYALS